VYESIAVVGGGNGGHTAAADFSLAGYKVNFYDHPQFEGAFKTTLEKGIVEIEDQQTGRHEQARIHKVTTDIKEAISDVELILIVLPAFGQELFFNTMIPHLKDGQTVFLLSGNFGSLRLRKLLRDKGVDRKVKIGETSLLPYATRLVGPAKVSVMRGFGPWLGISWPSGFQEPDYYFASLLPSKQTDGVLKEFLKLYPLYKPAENVLVTALNGINTIVHPAAALLNTGRIEYSKGEFRIHREGHTPSVRKVEDGITDELAAIIRALGSKTTQPRERGLAYFEYTQTHPTAIGPRTLRDRYITEDVPYGLVPKVQLGEKLGVATPLMNAVITLASCINQEDYYKTGQSLKSLGLDTLNKEEIIKLVEEET